MTQRILMLENLNFVLDQNPNVLHQKPNFPKKWDTNFVCRTTSLIFRKQYKIQLTFGFGSIHNYTNLIGNMYCLPLWNRKFPFCILYLLEQIFEHSVSSNLLQVNVFFLSTWLRCPRTARTFNLPFQGEYSILYISDLRSKMESNLWWFWFMSGYFKCSSASVEFYSLHKH